jgi:hypothetical protein
MKFRGKTISRKDLLCMTLKLSDDYLIGFFEGEGMFYIGIVSSKETRAGWQVIYFFKVSQNPAGIDVLNYFQKRLGCGYVKANHAKSTDDKSLAFVVRDLPSLRDKVIPFFNNRLTIKWNSFEIFKQVITLIDRKEHFTKKGMNKILDLAYSMNTAKRRIEKAVILKSYT